MGLSVFTLPPVTVLAIGWALWAFPTFKLLRMLKLWTPRQIDFKVDMKGKVVIVTGCNTGIGKRTAVNIAKMGATVVMACRSLQRAQEAKHDLDKELQEVVQSSSSSSSFPHAKHGKLVIIPLDLGDLSSVQTFVGSFKKQFDRLHVLVCNAGLSGIHDQTTKDGFDLIFGTNYLGHWYLVKLLQDTLVATGNTRIVCLSSVMHHWGETPFDEAFTGNYTPLIKRLFHSTYNDSKLAMTLLAHHLRIRLKGTQVTALAANPGAVESDIWRNLHPIQRYFFSYLMRACFLDNDQGSSTSVYCATQPLDPKEIQEGYYYYCPYWCLFGMLIPFEVGGPHYGWNAVRPRLPPNPDQAAKDLWDLSDRMVVQGLATDKKKER